MTKTNRILATFGYIISFIIFVILVGLSIKFGYNAYIHKANTQHGILRYAFLSILCFTLSALFRGLYFVIIIAIDFDYKNNKFRWGSLAFIEMFLWHLANAFGYFLFLNRLYYGFINSLHQVSSWFRLIIIGCILLYVSLTLLVIPAFLFDIPEKSRIHLYSTYRIGTQLLDFGITFTLLKMFINKLIHVTVSLSRVDDMETEVNQQNGIKKNELNENTALNQRKNMVDVMAKAEILGIIMCISTQITRFIGLAGQIVFLYEYTDHNDIFNTLANNGTVILLLSMNIARSIDCLVSSLCVFLYFQFTHYYYNKFCMSCHKCCTSYYNKKVENHISNYQSL